MNYNNGLFDSELLLRDIWIIVAGYLEVASEITQLPREIGFRKIKSIVSTPSGHIIINHTVYTGIKGTLVAFNSNPPSINHALTNRIDIPIEPLTSNDCIHFESSLCLDPNTKLIHIINTKENDYKRLPLSNHFFIPSLTHIPFP